MKFDISSFSIGTIAGGIIVGFFNHALARSRAKSERDIKQFSEAANKFRETVLNALEGMYPDTSHWGGNIRTRLSQANPIIERAVAEFSYHLSNASKSAIAKTLENYKEHYKTITWDACSTYNMFPNSMPQPEDKHPKIIFKKHVDSLLSYAREK